MSSLWESFKSGWKAFVAELVGSGLLVFCGSLALHARGADHGMVPCLALPSSGLPDPDRRASRQKRSASLTQPFVRSGGDYQLPLLIGDAGLRFGMTLAALAVVSFLPKARDSCINFEPTLCG